MPDVTLKRRNSNRQYTIFSYWQFLIRLSFLILYSIISSLEEEYNYANRSSRTKNEHIQSYFEHRSTTTTIRIRSGGPIDFITWHYENKMNHRNNN